jgi:hypothetical protein
MGMWNIGTLPQHYIASQPRRPWLETSPPWKSQNLIRNTFSMYHGVFSSGLFWCTVVSERVISSDSLDLTGDDPIARPVPTNYRTKGWIRTRNSIMAHTLGRAAVPLSSLLNTAAENDTRFCFRNGTETVDQKLPEFESFKLEMWSFLNKELVTISSSFLGFTAQLRPWPPPQNPAEFLGGFSTIFFFTG